MTERVGTGINVLVPMSDEFTCFPAEGFMTPILENADMPVISPVRLDTRLVTGWRHFGQKFFRYNFSFQDGLLCGVVPMRIRLENFEESKSQRRVRRRNEDLVTRLVPAEHRKDYDRLFDRHKTRFKENVPDSLRDFLSDTPAEIPCANMAIEVRQGRELLAVSFMDIGAEATSSVYAVFDPEHADRSLGIFTMLLEIEQSRKLGKRFHYLGYSYTVPSVYDYKKGFHAVEGYDWGRAWIPLPQDFTWSREVEVTENPR
jgi:arginyl-tRNA--protein-N-Asp/Glu arginylyltransferase